MRKFKKKVLSIIMTFVMIIGIVGTNITSVFADESDKSINVNIAVVGMYNEILFKPQKIKVDYKGENATAEDALKATGLKTEIKDNGWVESIQNQKNGTDDGYYSSQSGWMYKVGFMMPNNVPKTQNVKDGEYVFFYYAKSSADLLPSYDSIQNDFVDVTVKSIEKDNSFSEKVTALKNNSVNAAIMEALKSHGGDFDKTSLPAEILMSTDGLYWSYILNDDKNTYNSKDIQLEDGNTITIFKDTGEGPKDDEEVKPSISPESVEVFPGESFTVNITSEKGNVLTYKSEIDGINIGFKPIRDGKVTFDLLSNVKPGEYIIHDIEVHQLPNNLSPQVIGAHISEENKVASLPDVKVVVKEQPKVNVENITLDKSEAKISEGESLQLNAAITPENASNKNVSWTSSDEEVAKVDKDGKVRGIKEGTVIITAESEDEKKTASCNVTVEKKQAVKVDLNIAGYKGTILDENDIEVKDKETVLDVLTRTLDSKNIKYENKSGYIAMIADQSEKQRGPYSGWKVNINGKFPNVGMGVCIPKQGDKINLIFVEGFSDKTSFRDIDKINLNKKELSLNVNGEEILTANITPKEATEKVIWSSDNEEVAKVDKDGKITALKEGTANITATTEYTEQTASCKIIVTYDKPEVPEVPKDYIAQINTLIDNISQSIEVHDWSALDLNKAGKEVPKDYLTKLEETIKNAKGNLSQVTDYERTVLGILGAGGDPTNFAGYNLVEKIYNNEHISTPNEYIFGLIALDAANFTIPNDAKWDRGKLVQAILDRKTEDDGWAFGGTSADPDMTAMALSALAPYYNTNTNVKAAVDKAVERLSEIQTEKGGFKSWNNENSNSAAMVIIGLCDNGIDPTTDKRFIKNGNNPIDALLSYAVSDNKGFGYTDNKVVDLMGNEQGFRAIAAYKLFKEGKGSVYKGFTVNKPEDKLVEIVNMTKNTEFSLGQDAKITIKASNNLEKDQDVSLIVALYDKDGKFVNYVCAKQTIKKGDSSVLTGMMNLPKEGSYKLKALVWDTIENMNSLSDTIEIPVK